MVLIRHRWLDRQAVLWKFATTLCGLQQDFVTWKICLEASADMRGQQITFKPNCLKHFWKYSTRTELALNEQRRLNTSIRNAKVIYILHWSCLQLPTILMISILDWITVCVVDVCISYKTFNFLIKPLRQKISSAVHMKLINSLLPKTRVAKAQTLHSHQGIHRNATRHPSLIQTYVSVYSRFAGFMTMLVLPTTLR